MGKAILPRPLGQHLVDHAVAAARDNAVDLAVCSFGGSFGCQSGSIPGSM